MTMMSSTAARLKRPWTLLAATLVACIALPAGTASAGFGFSSFGMSATTANGAPATQAGSHPYELTTSMAFNTHVDASGATLPDENPKDIKVALPAGLMGDPQAVPQCSQEDFYAPGRFFLDRRCPAGTQVGIVRLVAGGAFGGGTTSYWVPVYNLVPPPGQPAQFGFVLSIVPVYLNPEVRTDGDYGISVNLTDVSQALPLVSTELTLWGVPADPSHDALRGSCMEYGTGQSIGSCPAGVAPRPFLTLPSRCGVPLVSTATADSWQHPDAAPMTATSAPLGLEGCDRLDFSPQLSIAPSTTAPGAPAGYDVELLLPQESNPGGVAEANLRDATVTLPAGLSISPSGANGLLACAPGQAMLHSPAPEACPAGSRIGSVTLDTPLLPQPLRGAIFLAQQDANPFGSMLAIYLVVEGSGVTVKLAGEVAPDPVTGQLTATFRDNPQLPFTRLQLRFDGGPLAPLANPSGCGLYTASAALTSWSGQVAEPHSSFSISGEGGGAGCGPQAFAPELHAGSSTTTAGSFTGFGFDLVRPDGDQDVSSIRATLPPGLLADVSHVPLCDPARAAAGSCDGSSLVGRVTVVAGPGPNPLPVEGGRVYLTAGYGGAPFGLSMVIPAVAGPLDLGDVVVRGAVSIDPSTGQMTVNTDPLPTILQGIPLRLRDIRLSIDRPGFMLNPTGCQEQAVRATAGSRAGDRATLSSRFQVTGCDMLGFQPSFSASTSGKTSRANGAPLNVKLTFPKGAFGNEANIRSVKVRLPKQLPSRLGTLQHACPVQTFEQNPASCPAASKVGTAKALTPVLPVPLEGPAYFVSHGGEAFPQLVLVLQGDGVTIDLVADTFIKNGVTSSTFRAVPDVPVQSFELRLPAGPYSALTFNGKLCNVKGGLKMPTAFTAQNGLKVNRSTKIAVSGCGKHAGRGNGSGRSRRH